MQPVLARLRRIARLLRFLLPERRLFAPLVNPVAAAIADHRIQPRLAGALRAAGGDARQYLADFQRRKPAPAPEQPVQHTIPAGVAFALQRGVQGRGQMVALAHQRGSFRMFEAGFKQLFAEIFC